MGRTWYKYLHCTMCMINVCLSDVLPWHYEQFRDVCRATSVCPGSRGTQGKGNWTESLDYCCLIIQKTWQILQHYGIQNVLFFIINYSIEIPIKLFHSYLFSTWNLLCFLSCTSDVNDFLHTTHVNFSVDPDAREGAGLPEARLDFSFCLRESLRIVNKGRRKNNLSKLDLFVTTNTNYVNFCFLLY